MLTKQLFSELTVNNENCPSRDYQNKNEVVDQRQTPPVSIFFPLNVHYSADNPPSSSPIIEQLLNYVRPMYHTEVRTRYSQIESMMNEVLSLVHNGHYNKGRLHIPEHDYHLLGYLKDNRPKRKFRSGGCAVWLLGRTMDHRNLDFFFPVDLLPRDFGHTHVVRQHTREAIKSYGHDREVQLIFIKEHGSPEVFSPLHIPLFYSLELYESCTFIEFFNIQDIKIFSKECECVYLDIKKHTGQSYPLKSPRPQPPYRWVSTPRVRFLSPNSSRSDLCLEPTKAYGPWETYCKYVKRVQHTRPKE